MRVHYKKNEKTCVDMSGNCILCQVERPQTGNLYHLAKCLGVHHQVINKYKSPTNTLQTIKPVNAFHKAMVAHD
jgi:hypothetical protein